MITNYIIIALLITLKIFLLAFILFEQFSRIFTKSEVKVEERELKKLKKEHISLTESEDEDSEQQNCKAKRASVSRSRRSYRPGYRPRVATKLVNSVLEEAQSTQIRLVVPCPVSFKDGRGRKVPSNQGSKNPRAQPSRHNGASVTPVSLPAKVAPNQSDISCSGGEVESSRPRRSRRISRRKKIFRRKNYRSKRGVKVVESWVRFSLKSSSGGNTGAVLKSKLESKLRRLGQLIAKRRPLLQHLPVVYENVGGQVNCL